MNTLHRPSVASTPSISFSGRRRLWTRSAERSGTTCEEQPSPTWPRRSSTLAGPSGRTPRTSPRPEGDPGLDPEAQPLPLSSLPSQGSPSWHLSGEHRPEGSLRLDAWIRWAQRSRLKPFMKLARSLVSYRPRIEDTLRTGMNNAIVEARNTQIRLFTRMAHGFRRVEALIGLAMLKLGRLCPPLPGRLQPTDLS